MQPLRVIYYVEELLAAHRDKDRAAQQSWYRRALRCRLRCQLCAAPCSPLQQLPCASLLVSRGISSASIPSAGLRPVGTPPDCCAGFRLFSAPPDSCGAAGAAAFRNWSRAAPLESHHCNRDFSSVSAAYVCEDTPIFLAARMVIWRNVCVPSMRRHIILVLLVLAIGNLQHHLKHVTATWEPLPAFTCHAALIVLQ